MDYDVAVVGCGPVGALAGLLLARAGLRVFVADPAREPHALPRAVHLDHEAMRLLQAAGVAHQLAPAMLEADGHLHIGVDRGVIRYMGTRGAPKPYGWANDYFFYQPELESGLRAALAGEPNVRLDLGVSVDHLAQDDGGVTLELGGAAAGRTVRAAWVVACDGARSTVRKQLGIGLDDLDFDEPWLVVDAEVEGPVRFEGLAGVPQGADLQRLSVMMCDPRRPATVVPGRGRHRRWEFMLLPGEDDEAMMRPERVADLLAPWLDGVTHRIVRAATYRFHGLIAQQWQAGRVFLAGDAAHQTPPFFGQGMCHGMRDVANLSWKLALVAGGKAAPGLLASYQREREPHVRRVVHAAIEAGRYICLLDPAQAAARDRRLREAAGPRTAADLIPPLEDGVIAQGAPAAGERFIQPWLQGANGPILLDDVQRGWRLFAAGPDAAAAAARLAQAVLPALSIAVVRADALPDGGSLDAWLEARRSTAVLVRPDFYVYGAASGEAGLRELFAGLAVQLGAATTRSQPLA